MNIEQIKQHLRGEGFPFVHEWKDEPNKKYPLHQHKDRVTFYVIHGSVVIDFDGAKNELRSGDRIDVPPLTDHSATVGPEGMEIVYGEMIEGDG